MYKRDANEKWNKIISELDLLGINYKTYSDDEINQIYDDEALEIIKIDSCDAFGLFRYGSYYFICIGDELKQASKESLSDIKKLVKNILFSIDEDSYKNLYSDLKEGLDKEDKKEHIEIDFELQLENVRDDYSDVSSEYLSDIALDGIREFVDKEIDTADWVDSYDYDWDSDSASVELYIDPDTKLTKDEISSKVEEWNAWYYWDTITQFGDMHDDNYYEAPWYDENEVEVSLVFNGYDWVKNEN